MNKLPSTQTVISPFHFRVSFSCWLYRHTHLTCFFVSIVHPAIIRASIENTIFPWFPLLHHVSVRSTLVDSGYQFAAFLRVQYH